MPDHPYQLVLDAIQRQHTLHDQTDDSLEKHCTSHAIDVLNELAKDIAAQHARQLRRHRG